MNLPSLAKITDPSNVIKRKKKNKVINLFKIIAPKKMYKKIPKNQQQQQQPGH